MRPMQPERSIWEGAGEEGKLQWPQPSTKDSGEARGLGAVQSPCGLTLAEGSGGRCGPAAAQEPGEDPPQPPAQQPGRRHLAGAAAAVTALPPAGAALPPPFRGARRPPRAGGEEAVPALLSVCSAGWSFSLFSFVSFSLLWLVLGLSFPVFYFFFVWFGWLVVWGLGCLGGRISLGSQHRRFS